MGKIYTGDFLKDHLGMAVIIGGLGAVLMLVPLIVLYMWVSDVTSKGTPLGDIILNVGFFLALFLVGGAACFYLMWRGINEKVTVGDGGLAYEATFFNKRLSAMEIDKIMLFDKARPVIIYDAGEEKKRMKLPVWRSNDYADGLIEELKRMNPNIAVSDLRKKSGQEYSLDAFPET
ncbi:MAG: hypothetical protein A4E28_01470 [Methanocella sp. PtaU1.Bin125]|nr:MAG: hypothetical protein A4E28_01470 [Methanocella sp. PtaU1.Bin125]